MYAAVRLIESSHHQSPLSRQWKEEHTARKWALFSTGFIAKWTGERQQLSNTKCSCQCLRKFTCFTLRKDLFLGSHKSHRCICSTLRMWRRANASVQRSRLSNKTSMQKTLRQRIHSPQQILISIHFRISRWSSIVIIIMIITLFIMRSFFIQISFHSSERKRDCRFEQFADRQWTFLEA